MKYLKQTRLSIINEPKLRGNCFPTVLACLMDMDDPEECLQIQEQYDEENWVEILQKYLQEKGYVLYDLHKHLNNDELYLVIGKTARGSSHVCIYKNGKLYHDPHPNNDGLISENSLQYLEKLQL